MLNRKLKQLFPDAGMILNYTTHWELFVAVVLSAQCTDKQVNKVTETLFKKYRTVADYADADFDIFAEDIRPTGFYRNKARNIIKAAQKVRDDFNGRLPDTMEEMLTLPGAARKTANVVLGNAFGIVEGIAVDTHVRRFAKRFDLTDQDNPVRIERDLMRLLPKDEWFMFTYRVIAYGRTIGPAKGYNQKEDPLTAIYCSNK